jgi:transcription elongation factor SPT6
MAADALDLDDAVLEEDESPSLHVQELMEGEVQRLDLLLLDDYAVELERRTHQPKRVCLNDIKNELMNPYKDHRRSFHGISDEEAFVMLTGESLENLYDGAVVSAIVTRIKDRFISVQLGSGVEGQIYCGNIDMPPGFDENASRMSRDNQTLETLKSMFRENQALVAKIVKINFDRLVVDLSVKQSEIAAAKPRLIFDEFFDFQAQEIAKSGKVVKKRSGKPSAMRVVQHPYWHSIDYKGAEEHLITRPRGEVVIRPSTKGKDHISISWKVDDIIVKHIDVKEMDKVNDYSLGKTLIIGNTKFTEIDQIIADYIDPMTRRINLLIEHPKYQRKSLHEMCKHYQIV